MTNKTELLPCPFCGGQAKVSSFPGAHNVWCENQPVSCGNRAMFTVEQWNTRTPPEDVRAVVDEPVGVVDESDDGIFIELIYGEYGNPLQRGDKLYRHPQRPMVLPERREPSPCNPYLSDADIEWNACLDRIAELKK